MAPHTEQRTHDIINISKTFNVLKRMTREEDWYSNPASTRIRTKKWLKAQSILAVSINHLYLHLNIRVFRESTNAVVLFRVFQLMSWKCGSVTRAR